MAGEPYRGYCGSREGEPRLSASTMRQTLLVVLAEHRIDGGLVAGHAIGPPVIPEKLANVAFARRTTRRVSVAMVTETAAAFSHWLGYPASVGAAITAFRVIAVKLFDRESPIGTAVG